MGNSDCELLPDVGKFTGEQELINIKRVDMIKNNNGLFIVATPIGNLEDISTRAIKTIEDSDFIICENPRHSLKLLTNFGIKKKLVSIHDYNEKNVIEKVANKLKNKKIVLISDAGSPLVSDPGFNLVQHCIKNSINVTTIPGPTSIIPALQLSGMSLNEFLYLGFFPKNSKQITSFIEKIEKCEQTSLFFVSSHKIRKCLKILEEKLGKRSISICKEITKLNEKVFRGSIKDVNREFLLEDSNSKGEFVVVLEKNLIKETVSDDLHKFDREIEKMLSKFTLTDVVEIVHKISGINKNKVYKWVLSLKKF